MARSFRRAPFRVDVSLLGDKELSRALTRIPLKVERKILPKALRAGGKPVLKDARALVPKGTGALRKSIKLRKGKNVRVSGGKLLQMRIFTGGKDVLGIKDARNPGARGGRGVGFYPMAIEAGYTRQDGVTIAPRPYMRPALHRNRRKSTGIIRDELWRGIRSFMRGELKGVRA